MHCLFHIYIYNKKNAENFFVIFEAIISSAVFVGFLYEMHQQTKNQKTAELRNEMFAYLNSLLDDSQKFSYLIMKNIILIYQRLVKHKNQSLINEFCLNLKVVKVIDLNYHGNSYEFSFKLPHPECSDYITKNFPKELAEIEEIRKEFFGAARGT